MWTVNFLVFKLVLEKTEEPDIKLPTSAGSWKKQESSRKTSISALLTMSTPSHSQKPKTDKCEQRAVGSSFWIRFTVTQLCSFHMLARLWAKSFKLGFSSVWTDNFQMYNQLQKMQRNQRSNFQQLLIMDKVKKFQKNIFCFTNNTMTFSYVDHHKVKNS